MTSPFQWYTPTPIRQPIHNFQGPQLSTLSLHQSFPMTTPSPLNHTTPIRVPPPGILQIGANNQPLVSLKDFQEIFAIPYKYGIGSNPWPRKTILLYKYSSHAIIKCQDIRENTWQRIDNDPKEGKHAESIMIKKLTGIQEHLKKQPDYDRGSYNGIHNIDVILSYSPCNEYPHSCSTKLCDFKKYLDRDDLSLGYEYEAATALMQRMSIKGKYEEAANVKLKITFANFYKDYEPKNMEGLKELVRNDIELDIMTGDKWLNFFYAVGLDRTKLPEGREDREIADEEMFADVMSKW